MYFINNFIYKKYKKLNVNRVQCSVCKVRRERRNG